MTVEIEKLKALALAISKTDSFVGALDALHDFQREATPAAVLELIAEVERLRAEKEARDALLRALNAVAIERGDTYGASDCIDNKGDPYQSQHLADVLAAGAPATGAKEKA